MIKRIIIVLLVFLGLYFVGLYSHQYIISNYQEKLPFSLEKLYLFHCGFSILVCINLLLLQNVNKISEQLGFIYLGALLLKILLFSLAFYSSVIKGNHLSTLAKTSLLIPTFVFLLTEVFIISKIINKKQ